MALVRRRERVGLLAGAHGCGVDREARAEFVEVLLPAPTIVGGKRGERVA